MEPRRQHGPGPGLSTSSSLKCLLTDRPMLDGHHRKVPGIASDEHPTRNPGGGGNEAVRLPQGDPSGGKLAAPLSGQPPCIVIDGQHNETREQAFGSAGFALAQPAADLLDVDSRRRQGLASVVERRDSPNHRSTAQEVDQDGGVEHVEHESASPTWVGLTLRTHPLRRVSVPFMSVTAQRPSRLLKRRPALLTVEGCLDRAAHERTSPASASDLIDPSDETILEFYVHSHVQTLAQSDEFAPRPRSRPIPALRDLGL